MEEGRLKPSFADNVDIPLAGARRLISRPRKASVFHLRRSGQVIQYFSRGALVLSNNFIEKVPEQLDTKRKK